MGSGQVSRIRLVKFVSFTFAFVVLRGGAPHRQVAAADDTVVVRWNQALLQAVHKRFFDYVRPITAIRFLYGGKPIRAWAGPGLGYRLMDGNQFRSYISTPPFAEYVSGHSAFSAASAEILASFTGSDRFGSSVRFAPGSSTIEAGITPATTIALSWATFSEAADEAALSRRLGGIHFESGDLFARALGRDVGELVWNQSSRFFDGTAGPW